MVYQNNINKKKYKLLQDQNEKNGFKFIEVKSEDNIKTINLINPIIKLSDFINFSSNFFNTYLPELKTLSYSL